MNCTFVMMKAVLPLMFIVMLFSCHENNSTIPDIRPADRENELLKEIGLYPDSLILKEELVQYFRDAENYPKAIELAGKYASSGSPDGRWYEILGILHFESGDTLAAIASFDLAIRSMPLASFMISKANLMARLRQPESLKLADSIRSLHPGSARDADFISGIYFNSIRDFSKAIGYFDRCLAASYTFMDAYREKAIALYELEKYDEAVKTLDKAITVMNLYDEGYYLKGRCLEKLNRKAEAIEAYNMALSIDPGYREAEKALEEIDLHLP